MINDVFTGTIGSNCTLQSDCSDAVNFSLCDSMNNQCTCLSGYYSSSDNTQCIARRIGDNCTSNTDCSSVVADSVCLTAASSTSPAMCQCITGFRSADNGTSCVLRRLADDCITMNDCSEAVNGSTCGINGTCDCLPGYQSLNPSACSLS